MLCLLLSFIYHVLVLPYHPLACPRPPLHRNTDFINGSAFQLLRYIYLPSTDVLHYEVYPHGFQCQKPGGYSHSPPAARVAVIFVICLDARWRNPPRKFSIVPVTTQLSQLYISTEIIKCRTLCKIPEVNWLKIGDIVRGIRLDHHFFHVYLVRILQEA